MNQEELELELMKIVGSWKINPEPEYRGFRCGKCQEPIVQAWHIWMKSRQFLEVHLCDKCYEELMKK